MTVTLDSFIPDPDVRERFNTTVKAPAALVIETAANFDIQSLRLVRLIFWLRQTLMRSSARPVREPQGLLSEMQGLGWQVLINEPESLIVCGAACQPWLADAQFAPIPAGHFAAWSEPNHVKIAWSLEATEIERCLTRFAHETRAVATDEESRKKFRRYWRWARFGIITIRLLLIPALRRAAEREWSARQRSHGD